MPLVCDGVLHPVHGLVIHDFTTDPTLRLARPWNLRRRGACERAEAVVMHAAPARHATARAVVAGWRLGGRFAGAHLVVDSDGTVLCCADLATQATYHAPPINGRSVCVCVVGAGGAALAALPPLVTAVSALLGIPRRVAWPYQGRARAEAVTEGGVFSGRDVAQDAAGGGACDAALRALVAAGWAAF